jgi:predicted Zn-dependent peptidase
MYLYARTVSEHLEPALDLLLDQLLHSVCAEDEVARERDVVTQEIAHLRDVPEDWMHELVPQTVWPEHPLGRPLLGTSDSIARIGRETLLDYVSDLRASNRLIVTAAGKADHDRVLEVTSRLAGALEPRSARPVAPPPDFRPGRRLISQPGVQMHFCLVTPGCARTHDSRHAFAVLDTVLGGGSSSRLFQEIRENRGLAYGIGSYLQPYREAGLFVIDAGTAPENFELTLDLIDAELERLREHGPAAEEVERAKAQLRVALALAAESTSFRMQHLAISDIYWGRVLSFDEIRGGLEKVTPDDVQALARTVFVESGRAVVAVGPF